jgi:hypothetical protein
MALDVKAMNAMLDALGALAVRVAFHTGDPGAADTASNEVSGGSYARGTIAWNAASASSMAAGTLPTINIPAGTAVTWVSLWNSAGTVRYEKKALSATETFGAAGTLQLTSATLSLS